MKKQVMLLPLLLGIGASLMPAKGVNSALADEIQYTNVSTFEELHDAIIVSEATDIYVSLQNDIFLNEENYPDEGIGFLVIDNKNVTIKGNGHAISMEVTGFDEYGYKNEDAMQNYIFELATSNLNISDLNIFGGADSAIFMWSSSNLKMYNSSIQRSGSEYCAGGAINNSDGNIYLKNCLISRNSADHGGGFNSGGIVVLDSCSLSENRSLSSSGGGGACEFGGNFMIMNNCTVSNNFSTELGGAINSNGGSEIILMNSTITGNSTNSFDYGYQSGGGLALNGSFYEAVNTIIENNYYLDYEKGPITNDIGYYDYCSEPDTSFASYFATTYDGNQDEVNEIPGFTQYKTKDSDFFKYVDNASTIFTIDGNFEPSDLMHRPALVKNSLGTYCSYLGENSAFLTGGCKTYLNVPEDITTWDTDTITAGYYDSNIGDYSAIYALNVPENENYLVSTYQDGTARSAGVVGANGASSTEYVSLTVLPGNGGVRAIGGSMYGDLYLKGTVVSVTYVLSKDTDYFMYWKDCLNPSITYENFDNVALDKDYVIRPIVSISGDNKTTENDASYNGGYIDLPETCAPGGQVELDVHPNEDYELAYVVTYDPQNDECRVFGDNTIIAPEHEFEVTAYFSQGMKKPSAVNLTYTGEAQDLSTEVSIGKVNHDGLLVEEDAVFLFSLTGEDGSWSSTIPSATDVGEYTIYWKYSHTNSWEDYLDFGGSFVSTIAPISVSIPEEDDTVFVYNGSPQTYNIASNDAYTVTNNVKTEPGTYEVTVSLVDKETTAWSDGTTDDLAYEFVIAKLVVAKPDPDTSVHIYNGQAQTYALLENDLYTISNNVKTEAGKYTVSVSLKDKNRTCWNDGTTDDLSFDFVIKQSSILNPIDENKTPIENSPVVITGSENGFDPETVLVVKVINVDSEELTQDSVNAISQAGGLPEGKELYGLYDAKLFLNDVEIQPDGKITIKMLLPEELWGKEFTLYHVHTETDGSKTVITITDLDVDENHCITFETDKLSQFGFVGDKVVEPAPSGEDDGPVCYTHWFNIVILFIGAIAIGLLIYLKEEFVGLIVSGSALLGSIVVTIFAACTVCTVFAIINIVGFSLSTAYLGFKTWKKEMAKKANKENKTEKEKQDK